MNNSALELALASGSPRRRQLLEQIGAVPHVVPAQIDETPLPGEAPADYVRRLAAAKSQAGQSHAPHLPVLGADTTVVLDRQIMGKPQNYAAAVAMLSALSGRSHQVLTAVSVRRSAAHWDALSVTQVDFRPLTASEIDAYWDSGEPHDKAGGYAIQGLGAAFVRSIAGSYSGVVGLPLYETVELLRLAGLPIL